MITVIVPVYNVELYLEKCMDSILGQTYRDLDIIVIDDGSADGSGEICDRYAKQDHRVRVFHTENRGLSAARNLGLNHMHGQHVGFVDSDDWIEPNMYENLLNTAEQADADIVTCRFFQEYQNTKEESSGPSRQITTEGSDILHTYLFQSEICQDSWNNLFKAELFQSFRYPEGRSFEDYAIKPPLLQKAEKMVYIPSCLYHYRNRQNSLSNIHTLKSNIDYWQVYRERFDYLSPISEEYYRLSLTQAIGAIGRMWRWVATYSEEEKRQAKIWLNEMQEFNNAHFKEILQDSAYSRYTKFISLCAKGRSALMFKTLNRANQIYRNKQNKRNNNKEFFA